MREALSENPNSSRGVTRDDVLSALLATIRLSGSVQFCIMPSGDWQTGGQASLSILAENPYAVMPFHILVSGTCWLRMGGDEYTLTNGDILIFPFGTAHDLGAGTGGVTIIPLQDLPEKPWREIPVVRYGDGLQGVKLLCGYLHCNALSFAPLRHALPKLIHVRSQSASEGDWLRATIPQMIDEVERPRTGGVSMLARLTEIIFIEILRHQIMTAEPRSVGWLAALTDAELSRCLSLIHDDPKHDWSLDELAAASGLSRSVLADRFQTVLGTSPIRYIRDWRLYLASLILSTTKQAIAAIAYETGYGTEAAFNRAFSRAFGSPPAA
jgi:AraC-like DNA-binding protein